VYINLLMNQKQLEQNTYEVLMEGLLDAYRALMGHLWATHGPLMGHSWATHGPLMGPLPGTHGRHHHIITQLIVILVGIRSCWHGHTTWLLMDRKQTVVKRWNSGE
jgi:hypothetical protein